MTKSTPRTKTRLEIKAEAKVQYVFVGLCKQVDLNISMYVKYIYVRYTFIYIIIMKIKTLR